MGRSRPLHKPLLGSATRPHTCRCLNTLGSSATLQLLLMRIHWVACPYLWNLQYEVSPTVSLTCWPLIQLTCYCWSNLWVHQAQQQVSSSCAVHAARIAEFLPWPTFFFLWEEDGTVTLLRLFAVGKLCCDSYTMLRIALHWTTCRAPRGYENERFSQDVRLVASITKDIQSIIRNHTGCQCISLLHQLLPCILGVGLGDPGPNGPLQWKMILLLVDV